MSLPTRWRMGRPRRFTRNLLVPVDIDGRSLLLKYTRNPAEARAEIRGRALLAGYYRVPALYATIRVPGGYLLLYERLPVGCDRGLLLDLFNLDGEPLTELLAYMEQLTTAYREVILRTARQVAPREVVRKLYWERAAPAGRLHTYYAGRDFTVADGIIDLPISRLADYTLIINGERLHLDWEATIGWVQERFRSDEPVWAAVTQGDPTDVNIAYPLAWFDYDTAGLNSILGEFANFLWYTAVLGGWLVPTYNPAAFVDHPATIVRLPANTPSLHRADVDQATRTIRIDYTPRTSAARSAAATAYWHQLVQPIAARLWPSSDLAELLRPYLTMRILGVYNLAHLAPRDRLVVLAGLARAMARSFDPAAFFNLQETPCPAD